MKGFMFLLIFLSCTAPVKNERKDAAETIFSTALVNARLDGTLSDTASDTLTTRFAYVLKDSSDYYIERYAKSFRYVLYKKIPLTEDAIKKHIGNTAIYNLK